MRVIHAHLGLDLDYIRIKQVILIFGLLYCTQRTGNELNREMNWIEWIAFGLNSTFFLMQISSLITRPPRLSLFSFFFLRLVIVDYLI